MEINFSKDVLAAAASTTARSNTLDASQMLQSVQAKTVGTQSPQFSLDQMRKISGQVADRFVKENSDLLYVIDQDKSGVAAKLLQQRTVESRSDLTDVIAETAASRLSESAKRKLDVKYFREHTGVASLFVLNTGGFQDLVNQDTEVRDVVAAQTPQPELATYQAVAQKAAALFASDSTLNDEQFYTDHPKVGIFLLSRPDVVRSLTEYSDANVNTERFKSSALSAEYQDMFDRFIKLEAKTEVNSGAYTESFFGEHIKFGEFVTAGQFSPDVPKAAELLRKHPEYQLDNKGTNDAFDFPGVVKKLVAEQAVSSLGVQSPISRQFLTDNTAIAQLIVNRPTFRDALKSGRGQRDVAAVVAHQPAASSGRAERLVRSRFQSPYKELRKAVSILT